MLDTSAMTRQQAVDAVLELLTSGGWLAATPGQAAEPNGTSVTRASGSMVRLGPAIRRL